MKDANSMEILEAQKHHGTAMLVAVVVVVVVVKFQRRRRPRLPSRRRAGDDGRYQGLLLLCRHFSAVKAFYRCQGSLFSKANNHCVMDSRVHTYSLVVLIVYA
jgi:hypothetical protein